MARRRGIIVGLLDGLELLLFKLLLLSRLGDACTVILCWKSIRNNLKKKKVLNKECSLDCTVVLNQLKLHNELHLITQEMFIQIY